MAKCRSAAAAPCRRHGLDLPVEIVIAHVGVVTDQFSHERLITWQLARLELGTGFALGRRPAVDRCARLRTAEVPGEIDSRLFRFVVRGRPLIGRHIEE